MKQKPKLSILIVFVIVGKFTLFSKACTDPPKMIEYMQYTIHLYNSEYFSLRAWNQANTNVQTDVHLRLNISANDDVRVPQNVTYLDFSYETILQIHAGQGFENFTDITLLDLSQCGMMAFDSQVFDGNPLAAITLNGNELDQMPDFQPFTATLMRIELSQNGIFSIPPGFFNGMDKLLYLDMDCNPLASFPSLAQLPYPNAMGYLLFGRTEIQYIAKEEFSTLDNLIQLGLEGGEMLDFPDLSLLPRGGSLSLNMAGCYNIDSVSQDALDGLVGIHFESMYITEAWGNLTETLAPYITGNIEHLVIKYYKTPLVDFIMPYMRNLTKLTIRNVGLSYIPDVRAVNESLTELRLSGNDIGAVDSERLGWLSAMTKLQSLLLYDNTLKRLPDLSAAIPSLTELEIFPNPLWCDCSWEWLKQAELDATVIIKSIHLGICSMPGNLAGRTWASLSMNDLCPYYLSCREKIRFELNARPDDLPGVQPNIIAAETELVCARLCRLDACRSFLYDAQMRACHLVTSSNTTMLPHLSDTAEYFTRTECDPQ